MSGEISDAMQTTRQKLLENFDNEVRDRLKLRQEGSEISLNKYERMLMQLTRLELEPEGIEVRDTLFNLSDSLALRFEVESGVYELPRRSGDVHTYRLQHKLAQTLLAQARDRKLVCNKVVFKYAMGEGKISALESLIGQSRWLQMQQVSITSFGATED